MWTYKCRDVCVSLAFNDPSLHTEAAKLLIEEWGGSNLKRLAEIRRALLGFVLTQSGKVIGYGYLQPSKNALSGSICILYSLVIDPSQRGKGYGRVMIDAAEQLALKNKFDYIYLSTPDAAEFYLKCGFHRCGPIASLNKNAKRMSGEQVQGLENMLSLKLSKAMQMSPVESSLTSTDSEWLRKRLVEEGVSDAKLESAYDYSARIMDVLKSKQVTGQWVGHYVQIPWQRQVGPSCGLTLLYMLRNVTTHPGKSISCTFDVDANTVNLSSSDSIDEKMTLMFRDDLTHSKSSMVLPIQSNIIDDSSSKKSLLQAAIAAGYTSDGEMFSTHNLAALARDVCDLKTQYCEYTFGEEFINTIAHGVIMEQKLYLIAYDRDVNSYPTLANGWKAHWLVVHGVMLRVDDDSKKFFYICTHGMSRLPLLVDPCDLLVSNMNCVSYDKARCETEGWAMTSSNEVLGPQLANTCITISV